MKEIANAQSIESDQPIVPLTGLRHSRSASIRPASFSKGGNRPLRQRHASSWTATIPPLGDGLQYRVDLSSGRHAQSRTEAHLGQLNCPAACTFSTSSTRVRRGGCAQGFHLEVGIARRRQPSAGWWVYRNLPVFQFLAELFGAVATFSAHFDQGARGRRARHPLPAFLSSAFRAGSPPPEAACISPQ